jgi:ribose 1,5-bisphosphokinase PhnN
MRATCGTCGLSATITPTARDKFTTTLPNLFAAKCPVLAEKLREKGRLDGSELDCPNLNSAVGLALQSWRNDRRT